MLDAFGVQRASQRPSVDAAATTAGTPPIVTVDAFENEPFDLARKTRSAVPRSESLNGPVTATGTGV